MNLSPLWIPLLAASVCFGLYLRQESMALRRWRSPTVAYLAKKIFVYAGLLGAVLYCALPFGLSSWLIYVPVLPLCGGTVVYVGSLGRF